MAGSDRDAAKADGCRRNLEHAGVAFDDIGVRDASRDALPAASDADCAVLNLPWGEKVRQTHGENDLILANVATQLRPGTPVACLATDGDGRDWGRLGYELERAADVTPGTSKRGKASFDGAATCYLLRVR